MNKANAKWLALALLPILLIAVGLSVWQKQEDQKDATNTPSSTDEQVLKSPRIELGLIVSGLKSPTAIVPTNTTGDKRLFLVEQPGVVKILNADGEIEAQPLLDIESRVLNSGEMGLLGLAFHPKYEQNGYFYVNYNDKQQNTIISRFQVPQGKNQVDPSSEKVLIKFKQPYTNHNGGDLHFGPDGFLYIALGDGGSGGDPQNYAQSKNTLLGKILRIDVDNGDPYAIPPSNPFVNEAGAKPEIWAYGLRNPWRISFDKATGDLYIADVGQGKFEEVNLQKAGSKGGENYGWRCYEGNNEFNSQGCKDKSQYLSPVFEYAHDGGRCSITGGYVYRGNLNPALVGKYFYGDLCTGEVFYAFAEGEKWQPVLAIKTPYSLSTFGQANDGELYLADYGTGSIYKIRDSAN